MAQQQNNASPFNDIFNSVARVVGSFAGLTQVVQGIEALFKGLMGSVTGVFKVLKGLATLDITSILGGLMNLREAFTNLWKGALKLAEGLMLLGIAALPGGFKVMAEVLQVLVSTIGQFMTPIIIVVGAALLTLAEQLKGPMASAMKFMIGVAVILAKVLAIVIDAFSFVINIAIAVVQVALLPLKTAILVCVLAVGSFIKALGEIIDYIPGTGDFGKNLQTAGDNAMGLATAGFKDVAQDLFDPILRSQESLASLLSGLTGLGSSTESAMSKNMAKMVSASRRNDPNAAQPGFSGIADLWKQIQMQAFKDPIATEQLKINTQMLGRLDRLVNIFEGTNAIGLGR